MRRETIRDFNAADAESVRKLLASIPEAAQWLPPDLQASQANSVFRLVEEEGRLSGLIIFRIMADEAEILNLAVESRRRRQGLASRLIEDMIAASKAAGVKRVFLEVRDSNRVARNFYARMGFAEAGRRRRYYRQPVEDALVLVRTIDED